MEKPTLDSDSGSDSGGNTHSKKSRKGSEGKDKKRGGNTFYSLVKKTKKGERKEGETLLNLGK